MRYTLVMNLDRCTGCDTCVAACKFENGVGLGTYWNRVKAVGPSGDFPHLEMYWLPMQCQQCENASCVEVCPVGASYRDPETNTVRINAETCIGCGLCLDACPFGVRVLNPDSGVAQKCILCGQPKGDGELPYCVVTCCTGARFFGDLDDPESDVSKELAKYPEECIHTLADPTGNLPTARYILSPGIAAWQNEA